MPAASTTTQRADEMRAARRRTPATGETASAEPCRMSTGIASLARTGHAVRESRSSAQAAGARVLAKRGTGEDEPGQHIG